MKKPDYTKPQMEKIYRGDIGENVGENLRLSRPASRGLTDFDSNSGFFDDDDDVYPIATSLWD